MLTLRTGVDLVEISRLSEINPAIRRRFLQRVFTPLEMTEAGDRNDSLAGRFAAKEAVVKALGTGFGEVSWQDIEIWKGDQGEPQLRLYGAAQQCAERLGLTTWSVSISHTRTHAVAVAVGVGEKSI